MTIEHTGAPEAQAELHQVEFRLDWSATDNVPASYANVSAIHHDLQHQSIVINFGLALPPFHALSPKEGVNPREQFEDAMGSGLKVTPVARIALSPSAATELLQHLQTNLRNFRKSMAAAAQSTQASQAAT